MGKNLNILPKLKIYSIDIGAKDKEEVLEMGIHVGCVVTFSDEMDVLNNDFTLEELWIPGWGDFVSLK